MRRARRIAWTAALISASDTPEVIRVGTEYLHRVAPFYACYGLGMALYFASQGAGRVVWPLIAGFMHLTLVSVGGWYWLTAVHGSLEGLFWIMAAGFIRFGLVNAGAFATGLSWGKPQSPAFC